MSRPAPDPSVEYSDAALHYRASLSWRLAAPRYWASWLAVGVLGLCALLPLSLSRAFGAGLGRLMHRINRKRRDIVSTNLALCFPELTAEERTARQRAHFRVSGQAYVDLGLLAFGNTGRVRRTVAFRGIEHYQTPLRLGQPVILLVPHTVGMNYTGALVADLHPMFGLIKPVSNPVMDWLLHRARTRFGCVLLLRVGGLRPVVRAILSGQTFYYLPDEDHGPKNSVFVPFFGVPAATLTTPGRMARLARATVVPCFTRLTPGGYEIWFEPALDNFPGSDETADAARMNRVLEAGLRQMPEQYMWTFKVFKTRPGGAPSPYER